MLLLFLFLLQLLQSLLTEESFLSLTKSFLVSLNCIKIQWRASLTSLISEIVKPISSRGLVVDGEEEGGIVDGEEEGGIVDGEVVEGAIVVVVWVVVVDVTSAGRFDWLQAFSFPTSLSTESNPSPR